MNKHAALHAQTHTNFDFECKHRQAQHTDSQNPHTGDHVVNGIFSIIPLRGYLSLRHGFSIYCMCSFAAKEYHIIVAVYGWDATTASVKDSYYKYGYARLLRFLVGSLFGACL
jgi:hypothetical protein